MIHCYEGFERTPAGPELVPVLVVRVPVMSAEQKAGLRAEIASSILDGLLLLEDGLNYKVVDLPLPGRGRRCSRRTCRSPSRPGPPAGTRRRSGRSWSGSGGTGGSTGWAASGPWPGRAGRV